MNRRKFFKLVFKVSTAAVVAKQISPNFFIKVGKWLQSLYRPAWSRIALPVIRSIFPSLCAKEFVKVQPMSLPSGSGTVFPMDFVYGFKSKKIPDNVIVL